MRLNEIKSNKSDQEIIVSSIKKNCQPYLKAIDYHLSTYIMYRGIREDVGPMSIVKCPTNRKPKDTPEDLHKLADKFFKEQFGIAFRSKSIFVTGSLSESLMYGSEINGFDYMFMPIGPFQFCWSEKITDFFSDFENALSGMDFGSMREIYIEEKKLLESAGYRTDNLKGAIQSNNEIMIHCKTGYLVSVEYLKLILQTEWRIQ